MIYRYELYPDPIESEEGDYINIEHIKDDKGDWCKAEDVDYLEAENKRLEAEVEQLTVRLFKLREFET